MVGSIFETETVILKPEPNTYCKTEKLWPGKITPQLLLRVRRTWQPPKKIYGP